KPATAGDRRWTDWSVRWWLMCWCRSFAACFHSYIKRELLLQEGFDLVQADALLGHRIALADRDGLISQGLAVHGDAIRCTDLVHAGVAPADRLLGIVFAGEIPAEVEIELLSDLGHAILVDQREDAELGRGKLGFEFHEHLAWPRFVGREGFAEQYQYRAGQAAGGFDHIGNISAGGPDLILGQTLGF